MNEWIQLANGQKIEDTYIVKLDERNIAVYSSTLDNMRNVWDLFGDAEKTRHIHSYQYGDEADWDGYTEPVVIQMTEDAAIISLRKS